MAQTSHTSILFMAGDASGDLNSARLAKVLLKRHPDWTLHALGGPALGAIVKESGGMWVGDTSDASGIGIHSAIMMVPRAYVLRKQLRAFMSTHKIDAVVMCDWGAFNCKQFGLFKKYDVPVLYYFPPGSWRRKGSGGLGIARQVERIATPFEWSAQRLSEAGGNVEWVGHPMLEFKRNTEQRDALRKEFCVGDHEKLVALLPGSRRAEISVLGPRLAAVAEILRKRDENTRFIVAATQQRLDAVKKHFPDWLKIVPDRAYDALFACDAAVVKSGTATLEAAVIGAPEVMVYDLPWIGRLEWIFLWMWKKNVPFIAIPNIILQRMAIREMLGFDCTPEKISQEVIALLDDESLRTRLAADYEEIRRRLGAALPQSATERTATILEELLAEKKA